MGTVDDKRLANTVAPSTPPSATLALLVLYQGRMSRMILPSHGSVVVGRGPEADIYLEDPSASRRHLALHMGSVLQVEDLGSSNGTALHGEPLAPLRPAVLKIGDSLEVGSTVLTAQPVARELSTAAQDVVNLDPEMRRLYALAAQLAAGEISVLLLGETGVGKELFSQFIHRHSPRAKQKLLTLNCAALSPTLLESELFGHERGAFTGATQAKMGLFEAAHGGTVFLDEIGEIPESFQAKLLRVLEERRAVRVGGLDAVPTNVRVIAATNRDLTEEVEAGRFRRDLYYRLAGATLAIPPLRKRVAEIEPLSELFLRQYAQGRALHLTEAARQALKGHSWPGNIRELRNVMERAALVATSGEVLPEHLGEAVVEDRASDEGDSDTDRQRLLDALAACNGNQTRAAERLGISRRTLINKLERYDLPRPRKGF